MLGKERVWFFAYADDIVLLAKNKEALEDMMETMKRFLKERDMILSTDKTRVVIFNEVNNKGKKGIKNLLWDKKIIKEVESFKNLGFTFNRGGNYKDHMKDLIRKNKLATGIV